MYVVGPLAIDATDFGSHIRWINCQFDTGAYANTGTDVGVCNKIDLRDGYTRANNVLDGR